MQLQLGLSVQLCSSGLHSAWDRDAGAPYSLQSHPGPSRTMAELGPEHPTGHATGGEDEGHTETTSRLGLAAC